MKTAVLFPGQGSQFIGMGMEFVDSVPACREVMDTAAAGCDFPLEAIVAGGPIEELTRAAVLQPAITATNLICLAALRESLPAGIEIGCYAGHSLGEYSALCGAGVLGVEEAIRLVERRGFFMEREGERNPGGMRAVVGLDIGAVEQTVAGCGAGTVTVANHNTPQQIVISGDTAGLDEASAQLAAAGGRIIPLNVSVANHSPLVAGAVPDFTAFMATVAFSRPAVPVYCNVSARAETDPETIRELMSRQIVSRVRWCEIIEGMLADGCDTFIEAGPKPVLTNMMKKIVGKGGAVRALQFDSPASLQACVEALAG